jgi:hypothetical protein
MAKRKVVSIKEITGMEGEIITMQDIFVFRQTDIARRRACTSPRPVRPKFSERLALASCSPTLFDPPVSTNRPCCGSSVWRLRRAHFLTVVLLVEAPTWPGTRARRRPSASRAGCT